MVNNEIVTRFNKGKLIIDIEDIQMSEKFGEEEGCTISFKITGKNCLMQIRDRIVLDFFSIIAESACVYDNDIHVFFRVLKDKKTGYRMAISKKNRLKKIFRK